MFDFAFHYSDLCVIGMLVVLEGLLSADNALVLAILVRHLPKKLQKLALLYGLGGAFFFRFLGILAAKWVMELWFLRAAGGLYLAYLAVKHFWETKRRSPLPHEPEALGYEKAGFWKTVALVELTDVAFAVDSILVAVAVSNKLWVVWVGGFLGIVAMRLVANVFICLLEKYPVLTHYAYLIVGWVSVKLLAHSYDSYVHNIEHLMPMWVFWIGMGVIVLSALSSLTRVVAKNKR